MKLDLGAFTSKVARRAFLLFVTCALIPVSALAIFAFQQVTTQLQDQSQARLQQASKAVAMSLYKRLSALAAGKTVLSTQHAATGPARFLLSRALDRERPDQGILRGEVNAAYLWAFDDEPTLPPATTLIVLDPSGRPLFSSLRASTPALAPVSEGARRGTAGRFGWSDGANDYLAGYWTLFLQPRFLTSKWTVGLSQSKAGVFAPIADFKRPFILVILMSVWLGLLLSVRQIRKSLTPLQKLPGGTRRAAAGGVG